MEKCKWENGKLKECINTKPLDVWDHRGKFSYCPFCGADIRKPKTDEKMETK